MSVRSSTKAELELTLMRQTTGLDEALKAPAPQSFTVFVPTDVAFSNLTQELTDKLLSDESDGLWLPQLQDLMLYHVIEGRTFTSDITDGSMARSINFSGDSMSFDQDPLRIDDSSFFLDSDVEVENGVLHAIDKVLTPPSVTKNVEEILRSLGGVSRWLAAMDGARLSGSLLSGPGPYTVFVPTDSAFDLLPGGYEYIKNMLIPGRWRPSLGSGLGNRKPHLKRHLP